jgi:hypothetical protein
MASAYDDPHQQSSGVARRNLIEDAEFEYTWNCENRLVKVAPKST